MSQPIRDQLQKTLGSAYTLERELGGGGMSRVFVAEETALRRKVVVKVLPPELTAGVNVERFNREILLAARLQHPHIVPVLSAGETEGLPYYTMPLVEGESLRARLAKGPLGLTEAVSILKDVARALAYAHERGIVHRDIKPDNVLLTGGSATVTDFGIAKAISASRTAGAGATLTSVGTSIGTPTYMSPEQAAGDPDTDHRADMYSFGCMAYELLAGRPPFVETLPRKLLAAHMSERPKPVTDFRIDTPPALADLVMRCLEKESSDRPQQASDLVRVLETVTSSGTGQALPSVLLGGPGMFKKALAIYAGAFVVVAVLAKAAIVGIGLPDWVFPGSLIVMALGLPVVLWTGYVQRVARRALTATPTYTPGGSPSLAQGTIATMALKAAPHVSWYKTARGGMYAFGAFIVLIAAFMTMRALGIGPFGSLIASGQLTGRDRIVIADFNASNADSSLGRVVSEAIRAGLSDARIFSLMTRADVGAALERMRRPPDSYVTSELARQVALREGAKAIVDGEVTQVGASYIISVRLVTADSGRPLAAFPGTAKDANDIINAADELSRKLRAKAGESLRRVHGTVALAYATTGSLEALRKYSDATQANDVVRDYGTAVRLLREAVSIDSNFAEAWRKLAIAMANAGRYSPATRDSALRRAVALSDRLPDRERLNVQASFYYQSPTGADRGRAIALYERMLAAGDTNIGANNLAVNLRERREYARAESLYRYTQRSRRTAIGMGGIWQTSVWAGKLDVADSMARAMAKEFPGNGAGEQNHILTSLMRGRTDEARTLLDSARRAGNRLAPSFAVSWMARMAQGAGRFGEAGTLWRQARALDSAAGPVAPAVLGLGDELVSRASAGAPVAGAVAAFDAAAAGWNYEAAPILDRPYLSLARANAAAGRVAKARELLGRYEAVVRDTGLRRVQTPLLQEAQAAIAEAEGRWAEAARLYRAADRLPDGPNGISPARIFDVARAYAQGGMADSAIAAYEEYRKSPFGSRPLEGIDGFVPTALKEALAKAYEAKGDIGNASRLYREFIEQWKNADPELQPRVKAARERLARLSTVEGKKP